MIRDPRSAYSEIKDILRSEYKETHKTGIQKSDFIDLGLGCVTGSGHNTSVGVFHGPLKISLVQLAIEVVYLDGLLSGNDYPTSLYRPLLSSLENSQLAYIIGNKDALNEQKAAENKGDLYKRLAVRLNQERLALRPRPPKVGFGLPCGDPLPEYLIRTKPPSGQVRIIPKLFYLYCSRINVRPDDFDNCDHWRGPYREQRKIPLMGKYKYIIEWRERSTPANDLDMDRDDTTDVVIFE
jgi:hypothetical protein